MRTTFSILAMWCFLAISPAAQDAGRTPPLPPAPAHNTMLLTGCVAAGSDADTFKLTNAIPNPQATAARLPDAAAREPVATSGERAEYALKTEKTLDAPGIAPPDLKMFVGRQVEITARPDETAGAGAPKAAGEAKADPDPAKPVDKPVRPLIVTAIKQVFATCR